MQQFDFDERGLLIPHKIIKTNIDEFKDCFVDNLNNIEHRTKLFEDYLIYQKELNKIIKKSYIQWINGSFATTKHYPNDIDIVSFIDAKLYDTIENQLKPFIYPESKNNFNIDAYIEKLYPEGDSLSALNNTHYWLSTFGTKVINKRRGLKEKRNKGFVEITINPQKLQSYE